MVMMLKVFVVCVLPSIALSCCFPSQWTGNVYVDYVSKARNGTVHRSEISEMVAFDANLKMVVANMTINTDDHPGEMRVVYQSWKNNMQYHVHDGKCEKMNLTEPFPDCVPKEATVLRKSYMGAGRSKIHVTVYQYTMGPSKHYLTVLDDGCVPVMYETTTTNANGDASKMAIQYFGMQAKATDASYFSIPSMCMM